MQQNTYLLISSCIFGLVATMHLVRVIRGQPITIGSRKVPFWVSLLSFVGLGLLSLQGIMLWR